MPEGPGAVLLAPAAAADDREELVAALHDAVLVLGGRLADRALATARVLLAVGLTEDAARTLVESAYDAGTPLTAEERELLGLALPGDEQDRDLLAAVPVEEPDGPDRTRVRRPADEDGADRALARALAGVPGCRGAWRADATGDDDATAAVWLVEAEPGDATGAELARVAGSLHGVLAAAGVVDPAVDVVDTSGWLPARPAAVRRLGRRIWPASAAAPEPVR